MVKNALGNKNIERNHEHEPYSETEKKLIPVFPEQLNEWRAEAKPIEQLYLSHPSEEFNLRLRETFDERGNAVYSATLKNRGHQTDHGLKRLEIQTAISKECYEFYQSQGIYPLLRKLRASPIDSIDIDFYEDGHSHVELENPAIGETFIARHNLELVDITGDTVVDNEWRAHMEYRRKNDGQEALIPPYNPSADELARQASTKYEQDGLATMTIAGRSGSGKSTIIQKIKERLGELHPGVPVATLSTDDYHRGKTWLDNYNNGIPWTDWDAEIVYNLEDLKADLASLQGGSSVAKRFFNFGTQEPEVIGAIPSAPIVIIEGLYAGHPHLNDANVLQKVITTPLATCIGRRLARDFSTNRSNNTFSDPEVLLRYLLENAEPAYLAQSVNAAGLRA